MLPAPLLLPGNTWIFSGATRAGEFNFDDDFSRDPLEASLSDSLSYEPEVIKSL